MSAKKTKQRPTRRPRAATADVVGNAAGADAVPARWKKHYERLIELRDALIERQDDLVKDAVDEQPTFSLHMADAGTDSYDRDFALSRISSEHDAVFEVDQALKRIATGTYGLCEATGKRIEAKRLLAIPWTRYSAEAEEKLEQSGNAPRAHLAPREHVPRGMYSGKSDESGESDGEERRG